MGERGSASPTRLKRSRQTGSEIRGQTRQRESEAGWSEIAGFVLSPEMGIVVVIRIFSGKPEEKADVVSLTEGGKPGRDMASVRVTTGVLDQSMQTDSVGFELLGVTLPGFG